jgi:hypothetical protein
MHVKKANWIRFEDEVFTQVQNWLRSGSLCVSETRAKAYRKRSYYSAARNALIEFEIAIEAFDKGATEPSLVWVWDCKDHRGSRRRVQVSDVEALNDKIDQLGRSRFKGSLVTTHGFQSGAYERAKSCGIALFVLKKELHRLVQYQQGAPDQWVEKIVVDSGIDLTGACVERDVWFEDQLNRGLTQLFPHKTPGPSQDSTLVSLGGELIRRAEETGPAMVAAWDQLLAGWGIQGAPAGIEKLREMIRHDSGNMANDNRFTRELIALREERAP